MSREVFKKFVMEENLIEKGDGIVVALSGGADSIFMTEMLLSIKNEMDIQLVCVHLNHLFRGEDADSDERYCKAYCMERGIPFEVARLDIEALSKREGLTFEEVGRRERYRLFESVRKQYGFDKIAVAQNMNDQGETLLLHLFRGAGLQGLTGIHPKRGRIIRPILSIDRLDLERYLEDRNISYCTDHTNFQEIYSRNYIRLSLLEGIKEHINPSVANSLYQTTKLLKADEAYLEKQVSDLFESFVKRVDGIWTMDQKEWTRQHLSMQRRLIRHIIFKFTGNLQNIHHYIIDEIIELCNNGVTGKQKPVNEAITFSIKYGNIVISSGIYENTFEDKRGLHIDIGSIDELDRKKNECDAYIDYDSINESLHVRTREPGDRFKPFGMKGTKKLKNHFIDLKISREKRDAIPLVCDGDDIVWIVGFGISDQYRVNGKTKKIAFLSYR